MSWQPGLILNSVSERAWVFHFVLYNEGVSVRTLRYGTTKEGGAVKFKAEHPGFMTYEKPWPGTIELEHARNTLLERGYVKLDELHSNNSLGSLSLLQGS